MQSIAVKVGFVALLGTTMVGAIYSEMVRPRVERSMPTVAPKQQFQWTWVPPATAAGVSAVQTSATRPASALATPQLLEPSPVAYAAGASEAFAATDGFFLPVQFVVPAASDEARRPEATAATAAMASLEAPAGPEETWASSGPGPEQVFEAAVAEPPLSPAALAATEAAGAPPSERKSETPAGAFAPNITVTPEPAALALLASGLVLLGLAGFAQQWRRGG